MEGIAIEAKNLTRRFGAFVAVQDVSLTIRYREIFGFLGPNGAGKSTMIRMLCGILTPSGGTAAVAGFDVNEDPERIKESIGYVSQRFSLYGDLTVEENLEFYGRVYDLAPSRLKQRIEEVYTLTGLGEFRDRMAGDLSGGWKQRLAVGNAILHDPKIIFLDEPTAGIDPLSRRALWELLYELADSGAALFVTTHYMEEAERCNQIAFISQGSLLTVGQPNELKDKVTGRLLEVTCRPLMKASRVFQSVQGVSDITAYGTNLHLHVDDPQAATSRLRETAQLEGIEITAIRPIEASLEDVFAVLSGGGGAHGTH